MLKDVKLEAIDQSVSMLMKKEPCNHDPAVSLDSNSHVNRPVVMKNVNQQAVGSYEIHSTLVPTTKEPTVAVRGSNHANNSSSGSTVPQLHPRDPRRDPRNRPRVIRAVSSLASTTAMPSFASSPSRNVAAVNKSPVVVAKQAESPVIVTKQAESPVAVAKQAESPVAVAKQAAKIVASGPFNQSHVEKRMGGWASSVNNVAKSPVIVSSKQADVVFGSVSLRAPAAMHHKSPVKIESDDQTNQATLDSSYSLCGDNTSSHSSVAVSRVIHDGDCSAKPIVLSKATAAKKSNSKTIVSPAAYHASRKERFSSEKVYTTSIPPYSSPSTSPPRQAASAAAAAATSTVSVAAPTVANKRAAETSVDELRRREQRAPDTSGDENVVAMENMLKDLKGKLVTLTLDLCMTPHKQELSDVFCATTTQINYLKRAIASLKKDTPLLQPSDENYKKLLLMMRLVPYFQWEGNVTNTREKVFSTIYACLRQVDRAVQDYDFDIERKWRSLIPSRLSTPMHHWLDGLLVRQPQLTWSQFKLCLLQEYEMPLAEAIKQLTLAHYNAETESMNSFVHRFVRNLEYAKVSEELGFTYFQSALPTLEDRAQFGLLYQHVKKNHPEKKDTIYSAIDLFRDIHNQICSCNDAFENPPLPAPRPQPYELHRRASQQPQTHTQKQSASPKVEVVQLQQQHKIKKQKFTHPKKPQLRCLFHPKAHSHLTENCRNNPLSPSFVNIQ
ncbi:uncharacterized protein ATC70_002827 [Mucor velutinosus]|uniref:Uncharacterized protein n=1 Tax=Mucor velutinosus TaxID=708070 RepID=A0AAN7DE05_9FUNG|nr:hypothetical protein ATC70_002827 [Mucor velutinosus]